MQMDNVRKETHVVSAVIRHLETDARLTERFSKSSGNRGENTSDKRSRIPCRLKKCDNPSCNYWHPPLCQNHESETGCKYGNKRYFRHVEAEDKPSKKSKKSGAKGSVVKGVYPIGLCVSQDSHPTKVHSTERKLGSDHAVKFSKGTWHQKIGKERSHCEELSKSVNLMSVGPEKGLWNIAKRRMLQDRGALPRKDGNVLREYQAMLEENFLSSWLRKLAAGVWRR